MAVLVHQRGCDQPRVRRFVALGAAKEMDKRSCDRCLGLARRSKGAQVPPIFGWLQMAEICCNILFDDCITLGPVHRVSDVFRRNCQRGTIAYAVSWATSSGIRGREFPCGI